MIAHEVKSMEESQNCESPKMRGGITLSKTNWGFGAGVLNILEGDFDFDFRCICGTSVVIPLPIGIVKGAIGNFLKKQSPAWLLQFLNRIRGKGVFSKVKDKAKGLVNQKLAAAVKKSDDLLARLQQKAPAMGRIKAEWRRYEELLEANGVRLQALRQSVAGKSKDFADKLCKDPILGFGPWEELIKRPNPETWYGGGVGYSRNRRRFIDCWYIAVNLIPAEQQIKTIVRDNVEMEELIKEFRKTAAVYDELTKRWQQARREADNLRAEGSIWDAAAPEAENLAPLLDEATPDVKSLFWDSFLNSLIWMLEITSIVQEKNCMSEAFGLPDGIKGASLNPETCRCSGCPSPTRLCDLSSWVEYFLPNTPGSRMSDELNVCIECCAGAIPKAKWYTGGLIGSTIQELFGSPPCSCECPTETQRSAEDTEMVPMEWVECNSEEACERGVFTSDKYACRSKNPPDKNANSPPGEISAYEWNAEECRWLCIEPCGADCCPSGEQCYDGTCRSCPPGYQKVPRSGGLFRSQEFGTDYGTESEFICEPDCRSELFPCDYDLCCEEDPFKSTFETKIYSCTLCEKTHSLRIEYDSDTMNPWG